MNVLFLISEGLKDSEGISKKIVAQLKALKNQGMKVAFSYLVADEKNQFTGRYIDGERIDKYSNIPMISKFEWRCKYKNLYHYINQNEIKLVFIRYIHFGNPFFISFLKKLKKNGIKVLLEIPTYPYDHEYKNLKFGSKIVLLIEKVSRRKFKNYVTRIITLTPHSTIFGVPAILISNGIDPGSINIIQNKRSDNDIHLIGVATMAFWHGYDRVIEGLHNYYSNEERDRKKIYFHIVGDTFNRESILYKELVKKYNLSNYIVFHGRKSGEELDSLFNIADIAVGSIGGHRISVNNIKALKNREYCARGIPFFYSETDEDFENQDFTFKVPPDDSPVRIEKIVDFVNSTKFDPVEIRNYAIENLTWDRQFEKIIQDVFGNFKTSFKQKLEDSALL